MKFKDFSLPPLLFLALFLLFGSAEGNVRGAVRYELAPSSPPFSPSRDLIVLHEDLQFDCDLDGCQVAAIYRIRSREEVLLQLSFISPSNRVEAVTVNGVESRRSEVLVARFNEDEGVATHLEIFGKQSDVIDLREEACQGIPDLARPQGWEAYIACLTQRNGFSQREILFHARQPWELFRFDFGAPLLSGENSLQVRYHQPYSFSEPWVRYFSSPPPLRYVSYELWPLREWTLDPRFTLDLTVRLHNPRYGFLYGKRDGLLVAAGVFKERKSFNGLYQHSAIPFPFNAQQEKENLFVYRAELTGDFADRLTIMTSEEETLKEVAP